VSNTRCRRIKDKRTCNKKSQLAKMVLDGLSKTILIKREKAKIRSAESNAQNIKSNRLEKGGRNSFRPKRIRERKSGLGFSICVKN